MFWTKSVIQKYVTFSNVFFQTHLTFGKEFTQAVELKQVAQQEAERAKFLVEKVIIMPCSNNYNYVNNVRTQINTVYVQQYTSTYYIHT